MLQDVDCPALYDSLVEKGYTAENILTIGHAGLKEIGLSFQDRKNVMKKIKDEKPKIGK